MLSFDQIAALMEDREGPAVSIFMPTHIAGPGIRQDPIRLKNLLTRARDRLEARGSSSATAEELLQPAKALLEDEHFWRHQGAGLALYCGPATFHAFRLPIEVEEQCAVGQRFRIRPLLPLLMANAAFLVLALQLENVRLFEATRFALRELEAEELPDDIRELTRWVDFQDNVHFHGTGPTPATHAPATPKYHAQGETPKDYRQVEIDRFVNEVARAADKLVERRRLPLVLAADPQVYGTFLGHAKSARIMPEGIQSNPSALDEESLHRRAWETIEARFSANLDDRLETFHARRGRGEATAVASIDAVLPASQFARIETLFVTSEAQAFGEIGPDGAPRALDPENEPDARDLIELAIKSTLEHGGEVFEVDSERLGEGLEIAANLRF